MTIQRRTLFRSAALAAALSAGLGLAAPPAAQAQARDYSFDIRAGTLSDTLRAFGKTTHQQLAFTEALTAGKRAPAVQGRLSGDAALARLLAGSGLVAERTASGGIVVRREERAGPQGLAAAPAAAEPTDVSELTVTGSNIRGLKNPTSPVSLFDAAAIADTGSSTVQEFLRSLPQNFSGGGAGASQDGILGGGQNRNANNEAASGVNLRGLGNKATLVLLDGHRMAPSAFGAFVDVSAIPLAAIQRIDVLTDGASSVYGADAVGGVVNLILRKDFDGAETAVRVGAVTDGGYRQQTLSQLIGRAWNGGGVLANVQYDHQKRLSATERSFTAAVPRHTDILPTYDKLTAVLSAHQDLGAGFTVYGDALLGQTLLWRKSTSGPTAVEYGKVRTEGTNLHGGLRYTRGDWRADLSGTLSSQVLWRRALVQSPPRAGYRLGDIGLKNTQDVSSIDLNIDGRLFDLPGGPVKLAVGGGYREEEFASVLPYSTAANRLRTVDRTVRSVYAEMAAPIVGEANARPLVQALDLSAAVRYDRYSAFGGTTNPKIGLRWEPVEGFALRGAWGTSFRAPAADELLNQTQGILLASLTFTAPSGVGTVPAFIQQGQAPGLGPEEAETLSFGVDWNSRRWPGARLQLNYYDIDYRDRIVTPTFDTTALARPGIYGSLISTFANDAEAQAYVSAHVAAGGQFLNLANTTGAGVRYLYRANTINAAIVRQNGLDGSAGYAFERGADRYDLGIDASYILKITSRLAAGSDPQDVLNNLGEPNRLRVRGHAGWSRGPWRVNAAVNHVGPYHNSFTLPAGEVKAWTTADLVVAYRSEARATSPAHGLSVSLAVINAFDAKPPYVATAGTMTTGVHYDAANADPRGRYVTLEVRKSW
ncbi:TonB-dependent receptor domain-containing protein [Phenylobacterium sp. VNQ135]|uniref:TonB-dependent receptor domain-containing protein n=1 Tax=Phenylobacterium sp. VNQ135 TaxID=3400922 RepID=UPI003C06557A